MTSFLRNGVNLMKIDRQNFYATHLLKLLILSLPVMLLSSCGGGAPTPRLPAYLGPAMAHDTGAREGQIPARIKAQGVGLFLISDSTTPQSAPPITGSLLNVLENRIRQNIESDLSIQVMEAIPTGLLSPQGEMVDLQKWGKTKQVAQAFVVILSSREQESSTVLGEERMMTQMPGVEVESFSLVEIALVDIPTGQVKIQAQGESVESMEQLLVPLGDRENPQYSPRDLLRANAAQKALDQAFGRFKEKWDQEVPI